MRSERKQDKCNTIKIRPTRHQINTVKTSIIREAVEKYLKEENASLSDVAYKLNWTVTTRKGSIIGDGARIRRTLGIRPDGDLDVYGNIKYRERMYMRVAIEIIRAIGRDPWEFNI